jgi:hypothetical protein
MTEQEKKYQMFRGKRVRPPQTLKVTAGSFQYEMPVNLHSRYQCWANNERRHNRPYGFDVYYKQELSENLQMQINLRNIPQV